jgi:hypothetical protein
MEDRKGRSILNAYILLGLGGLCLSRLGLLVHGPRGSRPFLP